MWHHFPLKFYSFDFRKLQRAHPKRHTSYTVENSEQIQGRKVSINKLSMVFVQERESARNFYQAVGTVTKRETRNGRTSNNRAGM